MAKLKADIADLETAVRLYQEVSSEIDVLAKDLESIAAELDGSWDGDASSEYIRRLRTQIKNLKSIQKAIRGLSANCEDTAERLMFIDRSLDALKSLFFGITFYR